METLVSNDNNLLQDVSKKLHQTTAAGREVSVRAIELAQIQVESQ